MVSLAQTRTSLTAALALTVFPVAAIAWEFSPEPICTLTHSNAEADLTITFDASQPLYTLTITLKDGVWAQSPGFGMTFVGPMGLSISTGAHQINGSTLTVSDSGFGNVLNGLEFNTLARSFTEAQVVDMSLQSAAAPVRAFRACPSDVPATS